MSGREERVRRDTELASMGLTLLNYYGDEALDAFVKWNHDKTREKWREISRSTQRRDPQYLFCLFSKEAHDFEVIRKDEKSLEVKVTKCVHADTFRGLNASHVGRKLICSGDDAVTEGFNPKIKFTRPKLLMAGDDLCHFIWELQE